MSERQQLDVPKSQELLEGLLTLEGSTGETYRRFWNYSPRNIGFLALQGCPPAPVATYRKWEQLGFHVQKGEKAYSILRPIQVKVENEEKPDEPKMIRRFKVVKALFHYGQVAGEGELPLYEVPDWSVDRAIEELDITRVPYQSYDGNTQGVSFGRNIAISPVAAYPLKTTVHEIGHVVGGHTTPENLAIYQDHRGVFEFEAEATAHLTLSEIGALDQFNPAESRAYIQSWMQNERPPEKSFTTVLNSTTKILDAGYEKSAEAAA